jgi:hypothetical protein
MKLLENFTAVLHIRDFVDAPTSLSRVARSPCGHFTFVERLLLPKWFDQQQRRKEFNAHDQLFQKRKDEIKKSNSSRKTKNRYHWLHKFEKKVRLVVFYLIFVITKIIFITIFINIKTLLIFIS